MSEKAISPLRRRLIEDMAIRLLAPRLSTTISATSKFADFLGQSATSHREDVHRYIVLARSDATVPTVNISATALRSSSGTLHRRDLADAVRVGSASRAASPSVLAGRGSAAARVGDQHQAQGGAEPDLCHRPASIGMPYPQLPPRQRPMVHPVRTGARQEERGISFSSPTFSSYCANGWRVGARMYGAAPALAVSAIAAKHMSARHFISRLVRLAAARAVIPKRVGGFQHPAHSVATHLLRQRPISGSSRFCSDTEARTTALYPRRHQRDRARCRSPL